MERTLTQHIQNDQKELDNCNISPQRKRHLEAEIKSLEKFQSNHPNEEKDPSPLELFCDENPHALECRIYNV
jgi:hypothetical protein